MPRYRYMRLTRAFKQELAAKAYAPTKPMGKLDRASVAGYFSTL